METNWQGWGGEWKDWSSWHAKAGSQEEEEEEKKKENQNKAGWEWGEEEKTSAWKEAEWGKQDWNRYYGKRWEWHQQEEKQEEKQEDDDKTWKWWRPDARHWVHIFLHKGHEEFELVPMAIGRGGQNMKKINQATGAKARIRGRGSGHLEVEKNGIKTEARVPLMLAITTDKKTSQNIVEAVGLAVDLLKEMDTHYVQFCIQRGLPPPLVDEHCFSFGDMSPAAEELLQEYVAQYPRPPMTTNWQATQGGVRLNPRQPPDNREASSSSTRDAAPRASQAVEVLRNPRLVVPPSHAQRRCSRAVGDQTQIWQALQQQMWAEQTMAAHWQHVQDVTWAPWQMAPWWQQEEEEATAWNCDCSWLGWGPQAGHEQLLGNRQLPDHHHEQQGNITWHQNRCQVEPSRAEARVEDDVPLAVRAAWSVTQGTIQPGADVSQPSSIWGPATVAAQPRPPAEAAEGQQDENQLLGQIMESSVNDFLKGEEEKSHLEPENDDADYSRSSSSLIMYSI